jgi:hypothetical protein
VFENRVVRKIFGPKMDEVTGEWRKLHNEELYNLYFSPNFSSVIRSRRIRWAGHVARMGERRSANRVLVGNLRERDHLKDLGVEDVDNSKNRFSRSEMGTWTQWSWLRRGTGGGLL